MAALPTLTLPTLITLMVLAEARTGAQSVTFLYKPFLCCSFRCLLCCVCLYDSISEWLILADLNTRQFGRNCSYHLMVDIYHYLYRSIKCFNPKNFKLTIIPQLNFSTSLCRHINIHHQ